MMESYISRMQNLPPRPKLKESEIVFGLCVDVFLENAWREGVLFGRKRDFSKMLVFFPETSNEIMVPVSEIRLTQEWNEVFGHWRNRGLWFFIEIIKKIQQRKYVLSEIKEMWSRLKGTKIFREKIKSWHSGSKLIWTELVIDLIKGTKLDFGKFPSTQSSSASVNQCSKLWTHERVGKSSIEDSFSPASTSYIGKCCMETSNRHLEVKNMYSRKQKHIRPYNLDSGKKFGVESYTKMEKVDGQKEDEKKKNNVVDGTFVLSNACDIKLTFENKKDVINLVASRAWKLVELEGEYCHDLLELSCSFYEKLKTKSMKKGELDCNQIHIAKLRKHLAAIGWRIEFKHDSQIRFRYISPKQRIYYSLKKVFQYLLGKIKMRDKVIDMGSSKEIESENNLLEISPQITDFASLNHDKVKLPIDAKFSATQETTEPVCGETSSSVLINHKVSLSNSLKFFGKDAHVTCNCLAMINETLDLKGSNKYEDTEALDLSEGIIKAYVECINISKGRSKGSFVYVKELRSKAKDYLLERGWKFWLYDKKVRKELRYTSPNDRIYISLYAACLGYLEEEHCKNTKKMPFDSIKNDQSFNGALSFVIQKEGLDQGYFSSRKGRRKRKKEELKHLGKEREPKRRKTNYPNIQLQNKRAFRFKTFESSSRNKPFIKNFASRVDRSGKRSRLDMFLSSKEQVSKTLLSWLIHKDVILPRQKVAFFRQADGRLMEEGWITQDGIKCRCCLNVFSISRFGAHVGSRTSRPFTSIILQDGRSLLDCQKQILCSFKPNKYQHARLKSDYSNYIGDDICTVCGDGGLLMLCDICPSAFHPTCIGLEDVPEGQWFCPSCQCSICGHCEFNYDTENFTQNSGIYCDQCERQYHVRCLQNQGLLLKERPTGTWTCSKACSKINSHLQSFLGKAIPTNVKGLHWTILRSNTEHVGKFDDESIVEHSTMLHIALDVLHECFLTMIEPRTQSDIAADIIFNNTCELNRLNFGGFYTMLLMCEDELISVATFRIFGERLAEMPFIGTRVKFRRQGMCRILMNELQQLLSSLGVERLLLPAVPELLKTWIYSFGFTEISHSDRLQLLEHTLLTFQGTTLCQKFLKKSSISTF